MCDRAREREREERKTEIKNIYINISSIPDWSQIAYGDARPHTHCMRCTRPIRGKCEVVHDALRQRVAEQQEDQ